MEQYLPVMSEEYKRKHYGDGVFARMHKITAKVSVLVYIFMGAVLAGGAYGTWWTLSRMDDFRASDLTAFGWIMVAVCALFALVGLACLVISVRRQLRGPEEWKERCARENNYTVADMDEFERQALEMESRVISLLGPVAKAAAGQEDGILTRDYIALVVGNANILKLTDLRAACLMKQSVSLGRKASYSQVDYLLVGLIGKASTSVVAECTEEAGTALLNALKAKCPALDTQNGKILKSEEYDSLREAKFKEQQTV